MALQRGLKHLNHLTTLPLLIEGDCLILVTNIRNSGHLSWDMTLLWRRTMHMLASFQHWTIRYCKRSANIVADLLAAYTIPPDAYDITELPPHIKVVFQAEKDRARAYTMAFYHHHTQESMQHILARVAPPQHMANCAGVDPTGGNGEEAPTVTS